MKQKNKSITVLMLGILVFTMMAVNSFAQNQRRLFVADTGVRNLGPNQKMRVIVTPNSDDTTIRVRFRRCYYIEQNGIFSVNSTQISPFISIPSNEAGYFDTFGTGSAAVRFRIGSISSNLVVTLQLIDTSTGEIVWADEIVTEQDIWTTDR